jgi:hypothetical protein
MKRWKRWMIWPVVAAAVCFGDGLVYVAADEKGGEAKGDASAGPDHAMSRVDGRVKDIDLKLMKLAVEVELEPNKPATLMILLLTKDTKVREREHARTLADVHLGNRVIVFYKPGEKAEGGEKKETLPTALYIRIMDQDWKGKHGK